MIKKQIMIRYGELNTKGKNKIDFVRMLEKNIRHSLGNLIDIKDLYHTHDHSYINLNDDSKIDEIIEILKNISGIHSFSIVYKLDADIDKLSDFCLDYILKVKDKVKTFKVNCKRSDKRFPMHSIEIIKIIATKILKQDLFKVDVHNPDLFINIEVHQDGIVVYFNSIRGSGGYPLGSLGNALMLLSGGIDSPVASFLLMKRGLKLDFIHFASPPYTQEGVIDKIKELLDILNIYQDKIYLHIVPFTKIQETIYKNTDVSYAITILRRMMFKISKIVADKIHAKAICTGESIGQVASQTLESMNTITDGINLTILRPLSVVDKQDIIEIAKKIKTYEISIRPYEDCCTIFKPKNPKTAPKLEEVLKYEAKADYETLIKEAVENINTIIIKKSELDI